MRQSRILAAGGLLLWSMFACEPPLEPAPEDINGIAHWLWVNYLQADDTAMVDAMRKVHKANAFDTFSEQDRGLLKDLTRDELAVVDMQDRDPKPAQGMFVTNMFDCDLIKLEKILYDLNQAEKYPEVYDTYQRTYTSSLDDYTSRQSNTITWDMYYEATPMPAAKYGAHSKGGLRYIGADDSVELAYGPAILSRIYMPDPAEYFDTDANEYLFDFQLELFYEPTPGRIAHFYPVWRHMAFHGVNASTDDNWIIDTILNGLLDWDTRTQELCAGN
ncbi:MAG: hypothetical protein ABIJ09_22080 [Pseudomonadota bacterium]